MNYLLIETKDSQLIAIDVQNSFLNKLGEDDRDALLNKIIWIINLAKWCKVPITVTAEQVDDDPVNNQVLQALPESTKIYDKSVFGLADQTDILNSVESHQKNTVVLVGLETDVCVMHSALGLLAEGFNVVIVEDATGSPDAGQKNGIQRIHQAGGIITNMKGLFYEWLRTVENVETFHAENPEMRGTAGIIL